MMQRKAQRGFTLIELMISLVLFSLVVVGILAVAVSITGGYREQRDAVNAEGLVRVPIDYMADVIRQASPGVSSFNIFDAETCSTSALSVVNSSTGPDQLDVIYASGGVVTATNSVYTSGNTFNVVDTTGLSNGDYVVISNLAQGHFYKITAAPTATSITVGTACGTYATSLPAGGYPAGSLVIRAAHATFSIATLDGANALWMDPDSSVGSNAATGAPAAAEPLAESVEDMQIAVGIDGGSFCGTCGSAIDGLATENATGGDLDEWSFNHSADTNIPFASWPPTPGTIRAVRITLISRSANPDTGNATSYRRPAVEDRAAGSFDNYRRRVLRTTIEFRNGGVSP